jgi:oligopeptide/dipeptide ABC transporter ATP-binding protein
MSQNDDASTKRERVQGTDQVILELKDLRTYFFLDDGVAKAVDQVNYKILAGKTLGLVGESGCGKSVTSLSIMRLVPNPPGRIVGGEILFRGQDLLKLSDAEMRKVRGNEIAMIFQEPMTALNPVFTVGSQIGEALRLHQDMSARDARAKTIELLKQVKIPAAEQRVDEYPYQMSGGMKQRIMIAMALSCDPDLLIADEPTTALDVTVQAQILELMREMQEQRGLSILFITHDLGVIAEVADHVAVMYASKVVEYADVRTLFKEPVHPYTIGLFKSIPSMATHTARLATIPGRVPNPLDFPKGCKFWERCEVYKLLKDERCKVEEPPLAAIAPGHTVACHHTETAISLRPTAAVAGAK